ncbi:hypothetical protein PRIPAC_80126 [Pristionchus pacificus]|uniref:Helicase n=1 Tax=Pristionchus pacificus TaxID=54126 RepID=A0A2A6CBX1_PRIPA|nr:hypothetical protein PRIPAC_80126 [Pristionchus pacificus]|eukprot:PDM75639.1 helicase [Pristionchus pacificus]
MERPENLTTAELRAELATYGVHVSYVTKKKRPALEEQLTYLRASGPPTNVERDSDETQVQSDLESIVKMMKENNLELRNHQTEALEMFWDWHEQGRGGILGDEMGLGKTCTTIVHLMRLRKLGYGPFLVFSPLSVVDHWIKETERFSNGLIKPIHLASEQLLRGAYLAEYPSSFPKNSMIIVAHTHAEQNLNHSSNARLFSGSVFDMVVVDEAQRCKNSAGLLYARCTRMNSRFLLLTGTPIQNTLRELYSLLSIVDRKKFLTRHEEKWALEHADKPEVVKNILSNYFLRRTKELVCQDLPPINQTIFYHGMSAVQQKLYLDVLHCDHTEVSKIAYNSLINSQQKMRLVALHPWLLRGIEPEPFVESELLVQVSEKLTVLDRLLKYLLKKGHSVLVFSQFVIFMDIIEDYLNWRKLDFVRIDGRIRLEDRNENVIRFNSSTRENGPRIFLLSTRAGGLGLNLTNADTVIFTDSDWNPQVDLQAMARCHRIGQTKPVRVIRLITRFTAEQYLLQKARKKLVLTKNIIGAADENLTGVSWANVLAEQAQEIKKQKKMDLNDEVIEKIVGKTDDSGKWIPITEEEAKKMEDDQLEKIDDVDDYNGKDIDEDDHKKYMGKDFRVSERERDELNRQISSSKYTGTRLTGKKGHVVELELEKDRELRLKMLRELEVKRQMKRKSTAPTANERMAKNQKMDEDEEEDDTQIMDAPNPAAADAMPLVADFDF